MAASQPRLCVIVGPSASGKERLALAVAERLGAEIVSVDSMKVYRGLDIATAKPPARERARVPHHCLDIADPKRPFSAAAFAKAADAAIRDIAARGKIPVLSGGTAFYYKALLEGLFAGPGADPDLRAELEERAGAEGGAALHAELAKLDPAAAAKIHAGDIRRLVRALEVIRITGAPLSARQTQWRAFHAPDGAGRRAGFFADPRYPFVMFRIVRAREDLRRRIAGRIERMAKSGLAEEARRVYEARGEMSRVPLQAVGYKEFFPYFAGDAALAEAMERLRLNTNRLVRNQDTWFRKFPARELAMAPGDDAADAAGAVARHVLAACGRSAPPPA